MVTNCAPLVANLFVFCNERDFVQDLSYDNQADIKAFNSTSRYLDDLLNIGNPEYTPELKPRPPFWIYISLFQNCFVMCVYSKIYDKSDDFDFDIVNFPFLDNDVPRRLS